MSEKSALVILVFSLWCLVLWAGDAYFAALGSKKKKGR